MIQECIAKVVEREDLTESEASRSMEEIMTGKATGPQIAAFLTALRMKGESVEEITAFASTMRQFCHRIHPKVRGTLVDTCGTGGDRVKTFNVSTTAAFVASGASVAIAKHGNRSVTSRCGSADILEAFGFNLAMSPEVVEKSIEEIGMGFMFAPTFHPAMRHALAPRREIGVRTVFNLLGPLTNPAGAEAQLLGVFSERLTEPLAHVLKKLGVRRAMVVHGVDGLDEISTLGGTKVTSLADDEIVTAYITPEDLGLERAERRSLEGSSPQRSVEVTFEILNNGNPVKDSKVEIVLANAAAAIFLGCEAESLREAVAVAQESIESGAAYKKLRSLIKFSGGDLSKLEELERHV